MRVYRRAVLGVAVSVAALAAPAGAQRYDRVVAFGDSYADIGNVKTILGVFFPTQYPTGRFSGGTNFVDTIAQLYGVGQDNYAIGGAEAGAGNVALNGFLPGFQQEWQAFTAGGAFYDSGVRVTIPTGGLRFAADDLAVFSVGGNDARGYRITGGTVGGADAAAALTAADATAGLNALAARGIRHLVWTAGDVGQLAEAIGQPSAAAGTAFSVAYNTRMQAVLAPIAASGVQVAYVDITTIGEIVRANPSRFGFIDTTHACPQTCIGNAAQQAQYLFYVDGVHLTSAGFALVGDYAVNQLEAPYSLRAVGDLPLRSAQAFGATLSARLDNQRGGGKDGLSLFGQFTADHSRHDVDATSDGYTTNSHGATGGVEYRRGPLAGGAAFGWAKAHANGAGDDRTRDTGYQLGGYLGYDTGSLFAQGYAGYGWHHLSVRRTGVADPLTANPHATSVIAGGRVGWLPETPIGRVGPVAGLAYAHARLHGYTEQGDAAASLIVSRQRVDTATGSAGVELRPRVGAGVAPWLRLTAEKPVDGDGRDIAYAPTVAPAIVDGFEIGRSSKAAYGAVAGGFSAVLARRIALDGSVRATFSRPEGNDVGGFAGLRLIL